MEVKFNIIEVKEINIPERKLKFNAYKTVDRNGKKMDVRFVRDCQNVPTEPCVIVCEDIDCNVDNTRRYPILWVKNVLRQEEIQRKSNIGDYFDIEGEASPEVGVNPDGEAF